MQRKPYGTWPSPITADTILSEFVGFSALKFVEGRYYWLEGRAQEGGRSVVVEHSNGNRRDITPAPLNIRSRVHEYGGGAYALSEITAYAVNHVDQDIYAIDLHTAEIVRLTKSGPEERFGGLIWDSHQQRLITIRERHGFSDEPVNDLAQIDVNTGSITSLYSGHDFYSSACLSKDGRQIAFVVWDHPNMPWDGTQLITATLDPEGRTGIETVVAGSRDESIFQPLWIGNDRLLYVSDATGFWNLYCYSDSEIHCILPDDAEYGLPQWGLGITNFVSLSEHHVIAQRIHEGVSELVTVNIDQCTRSPLMADYSSYQSLTRTTRGIAFIGGNHNDVAEVAELDVTSGNINMISKQGVVNFPQGTFSPPSTIRYKTNDGAIGYGNFYPPAHPDWQGDDGELPPLLVMSHGGPTGAASRDLSMRTQYYTSRGWAVLDVNYGGSTGFGRAYRERLNGNWGTVDVNDCVAGVSHLATHHLIDINRVAIRGGSAGGYTTLAALVFTNVFRAGASHYGIGDLRALAEDTHKFESRYIHALVDEADIQARSPINHIERLNCPTIFFQGREDRIVPPNQSELMYEALKAKGIPVCYLLFENEGHGFRRAENAKRSIEAEYLFFAKVFKFQPADDLPAITVENATWT